MSLVCLNTILGNIPNIMCEQICLNINLFIYYLNINNVRLISEINFSKQNGCSTIFVYYIHVTFGLCTIVWPSICLSLLETKVNILTTVKSSGEIKVSK